MAAILVSENNGTRTAAMLVTLVFQTNLVGIELFCYGNALFGFNKFALMLAT